MGSVQDRIGNALAVIEQGLNENSNEGWRNAARERLEQLREIVQEIDEPPTPYEERKKITMNLMKLWVVQMDPAVAGLRASAEKDLRDNSIMPIRWNSMGLILLPPALQEARVPTFFDTIKKSLESGREYRAEYHWPYGMKG